MKSMRMFKKLVVIMLSLVFILVCSNVAFAAEGDDIFLEINATDNNAATNGSATNNSVSTSGNNTSGSVTNNINSTNNSNSSTLATNNSSATNNTNRNANSNSNRSVSNTNALANTGLAQTGGIIALIVVICGVSAIYSYKKVNDYKNL